MADTSLLVSIHALREAAATVLEERKPWARSTGGVCSPLSRSTA